MATQLAFPWFPQVPVLGWPEHARSGRLMRAGRAAPAAVRVSDPRLAPLPFQCAQTGPHLFVHEGARQALERRLEQASGRTVQLSVTDNRRRMVTHSRAGRALRVRVHHMFLAAPEPVLDALVAYVLTGARQASTAIDQFIDANGHRIRPERAAQGGVHPQGAVHDLEAIFTELAEQCPEVDGTDILVTWARRTSPRAVARRTIKLGSYSPRERLVRVHPALDQRWVPKYFIAYILYHELLHDLVPPLRVAGRLVLHPPEFRLRERAFRDFDRALAWETRHIDRLLRAT